MKDKPLTRARVLAQAMEKAKEEPETALLTDVTFGRYTALGAGCYWTMSFTRNYGSTPASQRDGDTFSRRCEIIAAAWAEFAARDAIDSKGDD